MIKIMASQQSCIIVVCETTSCASDSGNCFISVFQYTGLTPNTSPIIIGPIMLWFLLGFPVYFTTKKRDMAASLCIALGCLLTLGLSFPPEVIHAQLQLLSQPVQALLSSSPSESDPSGRPEWTPSVSKLAFRSVLIKLSMHAKSCECVHRLLVIMQELSMLQKLNHEVVIKAGALLA